MPAKDVVGKWNDRDVFRHLVGEKIVGTLEGMELGSSYSKRFLVFESGFALAFGENGTFGITDKATVDQLVRRQRDELKRLQAEIEALPPPVGSGA